MTEESSLQHLPQSASVVPSGVRSALITRGHNDARDIFLSTSHQLASHQSELDQKERRLHSPNSLRPLAGFSVEVALSTFVRACKQPASDTLFITDHWVGPRLQCLREHLSDPITSDQADALCDAIEKRVTLDTVISWLTKSRRTWSSFLEMKREVTKLMDAAEKEEEGRKRLERIREAEANVGTFEGGMIAGVPIWIIPDSARKYPDFLTWWNDVGRLNPRGSARRTRSRGQV